MALGGGYETGHQRRVIMQSELLIRRLHLGHSVLGLLHSECHHPLLVFGLCVLHIPSRIVNHVATLLPTVAHIYTLLLLQLLYVALLIVCQFA